jgi:hypothetical protein
MEKKTWIEYSRGLKWAGFAPKKLTSEVPAPESVGEGQKN